MHRRILLVKSEVLTKAVFKTSPPLGLLSLAAVATERAGFEVDLVDLRVHKIRDLPRLLQEAAERGPALVGLSCLSHARPVLAATARFLRRLLPAALFVAGGPLASSDPAAALEMPEIDLCALQEGEETLAEILRALGEGRPLQGIPGTAWRGDGGVQVLPRRSFLQDLDALPLAAWEKHDFQAHSRFVNFSERMHRYGSLMSSRGCPYQCRFCHNMFGKRFRARSPEHVLAEVEKLHEGFGVRHVEFVDDIFNLDRDRAMAILEGLHRRFPKVGISFPNALRIDLMDEEFLKALKAARCYHLSLAIETASPRLQALMRKNIDLEKASRILALARKHGLYVRGFFILGFPTETVEELMMTRDFARRHPFDQLCFFNLTPFEGTDLRPSFPSQGCREIRKEDYRYSDAGYNLSEAPLETIRAIQDWSWFRNLAHLRNLPILLRTLARSSPADRTVWDRAAEHWRKLTRRLGSREPLPAGDGEYLEMYERHLEAAMGGSKP